MKIKTIQNEEEIVFTAIKCKRPKFKSHRGRTWDSLFTMILLDGTEIKPLIDTSWGQAHYFSFNNQWYKIIQGQNVFVDGKKDKEMFFEDLGYRCKCEVIKM